MSITVTGSRLSTSGFNAPTPVAVVGAEFLEARAKGTVAETLSELPAFRQTTGAGQGQRGTINAGQALLDLRGLGRARTLVLVNDQRVVGTSGDGSFDTNMIPSVMIQRTDVVTGGASAAYGSDAVAGVVNFVINRTLEGVTGRAQYGVTKYGDNEEYLVGLAAGIKLGDRGNFVIGGEYAKSNGATDQFNRPWAREQSALLTLSSNRPVGTPANIFAKNVQSAIPAGGLITSCVQGTTVQAGGACPIYGTTFNNNGQPGAFEFGSLVGSTTMLGGGNEFHHPEHYVNLRQAYGRRKGRFVFEAELALVVPENVAVTGTVAKSRNDIAKSVSVEIGDVDIQPQVVLALGHFPRVQQWHGVQLVQEAAGPGCKRTVLVLDQKHRCKRSTERIPVCNQDVLPAVAVDVASCHRMCIGAIRGDIRPSGHGRDQVRAHLCSGRSTHDKDRSSMGCRVVVDS